MMRQYEQIKKRHPDCLLFYRTGDFYELFLDDAIIGAKVLDIALTSRSKGRDGRIPMAGVPYHAVDSYLTKLVKAGYKVAICEQMSEPDGKGIVDREVIRIVTSGTILDERYLDKKENNYVSSVAIEDDRFALAIADITTGEFQTAEFPGNDFGTTLSNEISRLNPSECILPEHLYNNPRILRILQLQKGMNIHCFKEWDNHSNHAGIYLKEKFNVDSLAGFGLLETSLAAKVSAALIGYLEYTQKNNLPHFKRIKTFSSDDYVQLDRSTITYLELFATLRDHERKGSLLSVLDQTNTAMGGRTLREWLRKPLRSKEKIILRHEAVEELLTNRQMRSYVSALLTDITDIERIVGRLYLGIGNARDLVNLKLSLLRISQIKSALSSAKTALLRKIDSHLTDDITQVINLINRYIVDQPPLDVKGGGIIKPGINSRLDELRKLIGGGKEWILKMERSERERTGISSLKVGYNEVFGFYIEISKANLSMVPPEYTRKQTLVNGERFITPELKKQEELILTSEEELDNLEYALFKEVLSKILFYASSVQKASQGIAALDCLISFAELAEKESYIRPELIDTGEIIIKGGRHPVVEKLLEDTQFVPNDIIINQSNTQLILLTGPNMAGKSVLIRQVALQVIMAQIGCFVPASHAKISLVDRIFVRSGASDVITSGLSTFMVEMVETAYILNHATKNSLIIMDEIGRGTSTYDGISIAWAIAEYLVMHAEIAAKTLFATHYHELQELEKEYPDKIKNYHMAVEEKNGEPIFLYTLLPGGASHSFGVAVAKLAGVPDEVIRNAKDLLTDLENRHVNAAGKKTSVQENPNSYDIAEHLIRKELEKIDISNMTPLEALNTLAKLKSKLNLPRFFNDNFINAD